MSWPEQSFSVRHEPPQEDMANAGDRREKKLETSHNEAKQTSTECAIAITGTILLDLSVQQPKEV